MGTDIHRIDHSLDMGKALKNLKKIVKDEQKIDNLTRNNMKKVIENQDIERG